MVLVSVDCSSINMMVGFSVKTKTKTNNNNNNNKKTTTTTKKGVKIY